MESLYSKWLTVSPHLAPDASHPITNSSWRQWPAADVVSFGALSDAMARAQQWEIALDVLEVGWFLSVDASEILRELTLQAGRLGWWNPWKTTGCLA